MYVLEGSDCAILPMKLTNREDKTSAEPAEGRAQTKENDAQPHTHPTQGGARVSQGLGGVRQKARASKQERFTALLHHLTIDLLRESYYALQRSAAPGVDGVSWQQYEEGLEVRLAELHGRVHRGAYRAQASRRVYIPKADGRQRPLGIASLEDKIVQQAIVTILNQIYEEDFRGFSYGFRPGRSPHQALDALNVGIQRKRVNWILDADIRGFFDHLSHEWMMKFVEHRVADTRILRLIGKWLKAGVSEDGKWSETTAGWVEAWRRKVASGEMVFVRYADDLVVGFEHREDAERFLREFQERLANFALELHPEKTRLIEFGRVAQVNRQQRGEGKPETFTFLGFTHYCATNSKGHFVIRRRTVPQRMRATLHAIKAKLRQRMHEPVNAVGAWLKRVVSGYYRYHAVPENQRALRRFRDRLCDLWRSMLGRRSQRSRQSWKRIRPTFERWIPRPRILHDFPDVRFDATHPR